MSAEKRTKLLVAMPTAMKRNNCQLQILNRRRESPEMSDWNRFGQSYVVLVYVAGLRGYATGQREIRGEARMNIVRFDGGRRR
jgi:hypothetical protein